MIAIILIVLIPILAIVIFASVISFIHALAHKVSFYRQINNICKEKNYKILFPRKLLALFFRYSDKPDFIIEISNVNYLIRVVTCKNKSLFYNFPTPEWYVSFERVLSMPINPTARFKHLPPFDKKYYSTNDNVGNKCIMVFAPHIPKVSYLKNQDSKRELAGSSAKMEEWTLYNSNGFLNALNRNCL